MQLPPTSPHLERVLAEPSGNVLKPEQVQYYCTGSEEEQRKAEAGTSLVSQDFTPPAVA